MINFGAAKTSISLFQSRNSNLLSVIIEIKFVLFWQQQHADIPEALKPKDDFDSPVHSSTDSRQQKYGDRHNSNDPLRRVSRTSGGSDRSVEQSPLHRKHVKSSLVRKGASEGHGVAPSTPGRFKTRGGGRGDESVDTQTYTLYLYS